MLFGSCIEKFAEPVSRISVVNNSGETVSVWYGLNYPDTSLRDSFLPYIHILDGENTATSFDRKNDWAKVIEEDIPGKKIMIFIFPGAVNENINPYRWADIRDNYRVLKRYDLSADELEHLDFTVVYP